MSDYQYMIKRCFDNAVKATCRTARYDLAELWKDSKQAEAAIEQLRPTIIDITEDVAMLAHGDLNVFCGFAFDIRDIDNDATMYANMMIGRHFDDLTGVLIEQFDLAFEGMPENQLSKLKHFCIASMREYLRHALKLAYIITYEPARLGLIPRLKSRDERSPNLERVIPPKADFRY